METKRIVCLIAVYLAVLSGFALYARFDKQNEPKYAVQSNVFATGNNRSAASASAMQDDPEFGRFDCVLAQNDNDFFDLYIKNDGKDRRAVIVRRSTKKALFASELYTDPDYTPEIPVTDFIISGDKMRCLLQSGDLYLVEKQLTDNERGHVDMRTVYIIKQKPVCFNGHMTQAVFITPDIIRVSNSVGAVMHYTIVDRKRKYIKDKHGKAPGFPKITKEDLRAKEKISAPFVKLVWWNGIGDKEAAGKIRFDHGFSAKEPVYPYRKEFGKWAHMDKNTRSMMQKRVEKNSVAMKIPKEILLKKDGKTISLKTTPYRIRPEDGVIEYVY